MQGSRSFDPYLTWLGIPPHEQPPDHYRLLGLQRFEEDREVIKKQAEKTQKAVGSHKKSLYRKQCEDLLYRVNIARACLLNPSQKVEYDRTLKAEASKNASDLDMVLGADDDLGDLGIPMDDDPTDTLSDFIPQPMPGDTAIGHNGDGPATVKTSESPADKPASNGADKAAKAAAKAAGKPSAKPVVREAVPTAARREPVRVAKPAISEAASAGSAAAIGDALQAAARDAGGAAVALIERESSDDADPGYEVLPDDAAFPDDAADPQPKTLALADRLRSLVSKNPMATRIAIGASLLALLVVAILIWSPWRAGQTAAVRPQLQQTHVISQKPAAPPPPVEVAVGSPAVVPKTPDVPQSPPPVASPRAAADSAPVEIGIVYGTEKTTWLQWANKEFAKSDEGRNIRVTLIPMGSMEGAHAVLDGDTRIDVWSPASGIYKESFLRDWDAKYHGGNPIVREDLLAITPMVIVMWKNRYDIFIRRSPEVSLRTIGYAMHTVGGWRGIGGNAEWGDFKFGHTYPNQSNSGLAMLLLLAYEFHAKHSGLTVDDIMSQKLQDYLAWFGQRSFGQSHSTGDLMKEMVLKGPSSYDALMVYESVAIDYLRQAEGRWDQLQIIYPKYNLWNDNPYYVLKTPWSTPARQEAAETFLRFLMSEPIQLRALDHGFRPGNPAVPVQGPKSPFTRYAASGLRIDIPTVCETPPADVIENVQQSWARNVRSH